MSYIKRLKLKGFKSFSNPTILDFEKGFNTVVGPNGSGKSNIFDALCFVLGRMSSKGLRADKLGNLVFNGGKHLKPSKEAEVSIFLSNENKELINSELDEIQITRIVKNDGQSKYLLNNNKVTRTEIIEVLKKASIDPDGYNIILQGDIMKIVNMTPVERRELIEEISNISGYEEQRTKSLKKLESVENNLKEADLLMEEKTKYLRELKSEKEQAEKFHNVKNELRFNNLLLVKAKLIRNSLLKKKKEEEFKINEVELEDYKQKLNEFEKQSKNIDRQISEIEKTIEIKSHEDFISVTNKITSLDAELQKLKERKAEYKKQTEEIKTRNEGIKENILKNKQKHLQFEILLKGFDKEKIELEKELKIYELQLIELKKGISSKSFKELDEIDKSIDELNEKKLEKNNLRQDNSIQIEKLNTKLEHIQQDFERVINSNLSNKKQFQELEENKKELKKLIMQISEKTNKNSETVAKLNNLQKEYSVLIEEHSRLKMKTDASRELIATNKAVDAITKLQTKDSSIHGTVAQLASVPEKYSLAMETVAGKSLFNIVVENDNTAVKYINYLKEQRIGNATFLPLNKIHAKYKLNDNILNKKGVIDFALNLINYDKKYENVFHLIFSNTIVIEKIEYAKNIGIGDYKMITLEGDIIAKSGAMSGGYKNRKQGLGAFKDDKMMEKLENNEKRIMILKNTIEHLKEEKDDSERQIYNLRQKKMDIEGDIAKLEKLLSIEGRDTDSMKKEIEALISDKIIIEGSLKKIDKDIKLIDENIGKFLIKKSKFKINSSHQGNTVNEISRLEEEKDKLKDKLISINSEINTKNIQVNNVLIPETANLEKILKENEESNIKIKLLGNELSIKIKELEEELKKFKIREKELSKDYKQYIEKRDKLKADKLRLEQKYEKEFHKFDSIKEKSSQLRYVINEFETLDKTLNDELEMQYESIKTEFITTDEDGNITGHKRVEKLIAEVENMLRNKSIDVKELQNKVNNLKTKINSFGSINMKAVEIYDKLNEEFNELIEKRKALNIDKIEILNFIAEMDLKKKEKFLETFSKLKESFIKTFASLSTKGDAELNLEDEKDIFNCGVDIKVRLSEKNYLDIKSLSGGEKTITAVAFIFAVQEFNPASFYIFDEIDAALDILNSEKLGKLIKDSAHKAQYIVVSHNEYLIQSAEIIYGVTMDKNKISGIVSLDLRDMKEYLDDETTPTVKN